MFPYSFSKDSATICVLLLRLSQYLNFRYQLTVNKSCQGKNSCKLKFAQE